MLEVEGALIAGAHLIVGDYAANEIQEEAEPYRNTMAQDKLGGKENLERKSQMEEMKQANLWVSRRIIGSDYDHYLIQASQLQNINYIVPSMFL